MRLFSRIYNCFSRKNVNSAIPKQIQLPASSNTQPRFNFTTYNISESPLIFDSLLQKIKSKQRSIYLLQEVPRRHAKTYKNNPYMKLCSTDRSQICMMFSQDIAGMIGNEIGADEKFCVITLHTSKGDIDIINFHGYAKSSSDTKDSKFFSHVSKAYSMRSNNKYIIAGDFNREPFDESLAGKFGFFGRRHVCDLNEDKNANINVSWKFMAQDSEPFGTLLFDNLESITRWGVYDQFILSQELYRQSRILNSQILRKISTIDCLAKARIKKERNSQHLPVTLTLELC